MFKGSYWRYYVLPLCAVANIHAWKQHSVFAVLFTFAIAIVVA